MLSARPGGADSRSSWTANGLQNLSVPFSSSTNYFIVSLTVGPRFVLAGKGGAESVRSVVLTRLLFSDERLEFTKNKSFTSVGFSDIYT